MLQPLLAPLLAPRKELVGDVLAAGGRAALLAVAGGTSLTDARDVLAALSF